MIIILGIHHHVLRKNITKTNGLRQSDDASTAIIGRNERGRTAEDQMTQKQNSPPPLIHHAEYKT